MPDFRSLRVAVCCWLVLGLVCRSAPAQPGGPFVRQPHDREPTRVPELPKRGVYSVKQAVRVEFSGACLAPRRLVDEVERWLKTDEIDERIEVMVLGAEQPTLGASFWLVVDGERASVRRFEAFTGNCDELTSALGAAIGLAIEAVELPELTVEIPATVPVGVPRPVVRLPRRPKSSLHRGATGWGLRGQGMFAAGAAFGPAWGGSSHLELIAARELRVRVGGHYLAGSREPLADGWVGSRVIGGQLGGCWGGEERAVVGRLCLDFWFSAVRAEPEELQRPRTATLPAFSVVPTAETAIDLGHGLSIVGGAHLLINLARPRVEAHLTTRPEVLDQLSVPALGVAASLGVAWATRERASLK